MLNNSEPQPEASQAPTGGGIESLSSLSTITTTTTTTTTNNNNVKRRRKSSLRMQVFAFLKNPQIEVVFMLAVVLSSFLVTLTTLDENIISENSQTMIRHVISSTNILFAIEFFVRWYSAGNFRLQYLTKPSAILDIAVVLIPTVSGGLASLNEVTQLALPNMIIADTSVGLENLLLLRILRLRRVLTDIKTFRRFLSALGVVSASNSNQTVRPYQLQLARVLLSVFTLLSVASGLIYSSEHKLNPSINNYYEALYFGLTTLTTVGFGDITPVTPQGRLVVGLSILVGVAVVPSQAANFVDALLEYDADRRNSRRRRVIVPTEQEQMMGVSSVLLKQQSDWRKYADEDAIGWKGKCCLTCHCTEHREDAKYCWSCGSKL